jgi:hypothetical protein
MLLLWRYDCSNKGEFERSFCGLIGRFFVVGLLCDSLIAMPVTSLKLLRFLQMIH